MESLSNSIAQMDSSGLRRICIRNVCYIDIYWTIGVLTWYNKYANGTLCGIKPNGGIWESMPSVLNTFLIQYTYRSEKWIQKHPCRPIAFWDSFQNVFNNIKYEKNMSIFIIFH